MKLEDAIYQAPEINEQKLLENIKIWIPYVKPSLIRKLEKEYSINKMDSDNTIEKAFLKEWDLIQQKKSKFSRMERDFICTLVSRCMVKMVKNGRE